MADECKTMQIPVMLKEAADTGLITQESLDALEAEKILAKEKIENLKSLYREKLISFEQLEGGIRGIQRELEDKIMALDFNNT